LGQPVSTFICFAAVIAVVLLARLYGRAVGMVAAATCGVSVAWAMPPAFSLEVDSLLDQAVLAAYGAVSLLLLYRVPPRFKLDFTAGSIPIQSGTPLSSIVSRVLPAGIEVSVGEINIEASVEEAETALREVFRTALLAQPGIERLIIYGGRWPGVDRIWVAAQYRELPPDSCIRIGARRALTWFDNGFERVYQISLNR
jgi:hypothetical protein